MNSGVDQGSRTRAGAADVATACMRESKGYAERADWTVDDDHVVLVLGFGEAVDRKHCPLLLAVLGDLDALERRLVILDFERDPRPVALAASPADDDLRRRVVDLERHALEL